jgi:membrane-associated protein
MGQLATGLLSLSGWAALTLLFMLPALEAPAFLGLVLPGELALLLGGVLAHQDRISLVAALAVGVAGAVAGDTAGYWIGRRWGPRLLTSGLGRRVGPARLHTVEGLLLRGGGWALVVGRGTAGVRVVLPGLAGMLGLRYRTFALWTGAAATLWAVAHVLLGYAAGAGWRHVLQLTGRIGIALAGAVMVALAVAWLLRRQARGHQDQPASPSPPGGAAPSTPAVDRDLARWTWPRRVGSAGRPPLMIRCCEHNQRSDGGRRPQRRGRPAPMAAMPGRAAGPDRRPVWPGGATTARQGVRVWAAG